MLEIALWNLVSCFESWFFVSCI